jgi:hypothetical protein
MTTAPGDKTTYVAHVCHRFVSPVSLRRSSSVSQKTPVPKEELRVAVHWRCEGRAEDQTADVLERWLACRSLGPGVGYSIHLVESFPNPFASEVLQLARVVAVLARHTIIHYSGQKQG